MTITIDKDSPPGSWKKEIEIRELQGTLKPAMAYSWSEWIAYGRLLAQGHKDGGLIPSMLGVIEAVTASKP